MLEPTTAEPITACGRFLLNIRDEKDGKDEEASSQIRTGLLFAWFTSKVPPLRNSITCGPGWTGLGTD
jgi:hypothetical protein